MSISSTTNRNNYTGNGAVNTYSYNFRILEESDLLVTVADTSGTETTLTLTTDYTVTGVGDEPGGTIVLVNSGQAWLTSGNLTTGYALSIRRVVPLTQLTDIRNQGDFFPEVHEDTFDRLVMIAQQQQDQLNRVVTFGETSTLTGIELPNPVAETFLRWNSAADALENAQPGSVGDAIFPPSSTDNAIVRFDGATGLALQNSGITIDDTDNMTIPGNLTVTGDLQVDGTQTILNVQTLDVEDQNITMNNGGNQVSADGLAGLRIEMSDATDVSMIYDSTLDSRFKIGDLGTEREILTTSGTQVITNKDYDGGTASNARRIKLPSDTTTNLDLLTDIAGLIAFDTTLGNPVYNAGAGWLNFADLGSVAIQQFTSSGTWNKPSNLKQAIVITTGGGGAGGGANSSGSTSNALSAGGGGGGGTAIELFDESALPSSVSVTVGGGGAAVAGTNGGTGGTSSFGGFHSASGGIGGFAPISGTSGHHYATLGGLGGIGSGGTLNLRGHSGGTGAADDTVNSIGTGGPGGGSFFGGGRSVATMSQGSGVTGTSATANSGGGGAGASLQRVNQNIAGGAGGSGRVVVIELLST